MADRCWTEKNAKQNENISQITKNTEKYRRWILVGQRNNNISFVIHIKFGAGVRGILLPQKLLCR